MKLKLKLSQPVAYVNPYLNLRGRYRRYWEFREKLFEDAAGSLHPPLLKPYSRTIPRVLWWS